MSMYGKTHYNTIISIQLIKINEKKKAKILKRFYFKEDRQTANNYTKDVQYY